MNETDPRVVFTLLNEIGIIEQLGRVVVEAKLPDGFLVSHFGVLNHLCRVKDGQTPLFLARAFQVPKTSMTHTLSGLEKNGLIALRPNPDDGRSKQVWITESGRKFRNDTIDKLVPEMESLVAEIPAEEIQQILPVLQRIRTFMDAARN